jgi:hypothetical protein
MEFDVYLKAFGVGFVVWLVAALPLVVATIVALYPGKYVPRKRLFVILSSVISYGVAVLVFVAFVPISLLATFFSPQWAAQGYQSLASTIETLAEVGSVLPIIVVATGSFLIPIVARKKYWDYIAKYTASKSLNQIGAKDAPPG